MDTIWVGIDPRPQHTRILAMSGPEETILKARLFQSPSSRLALGALLEALALWQGHKVRAALVAGGEAASGSILYREALSDFGNALYSIDYVGAVRRPRRRDGLSDMGAFGDLRQLLLFEGLR